MKKRTLTVATGDPGRLDQLLVARLRCTLAEARQWIAQGAIYVDGTRTTSSGTVAPGAKLQVYAASPPTEAWSVVHEDKRLIVVDKPAGTPVQATRSDERGALDHQVIERWPDARLLHRIDREV